MKPLITQRMSLRKDRGECRRCKTDRGPPYFGMSFRHVTNFVRNSHDPLMFADLAQICLYQKSPSSSVYLSMHSRLLCAGSLAQPDCQQFTFSKHVCLPAHVGSSFSIGVALSALPSTMADSVLHVIAPVRSLLLLLLCGIVLSMCEASCSWFFRVWRPRLPRPQCKACRFVAGCRRNFASTCLFLWSLRWPHLTIQVGPKLYELHQYQINSSR